MFTAAIKKAEEITLLSSIEQFCAQNSVKYEIKTEEIKSTKDFSGELIMFYDGTAKPKRIDTKEKELHVIDKRFITIQHVSKKGVLLDLKIQAYDYLSRLNLTLFKEFSQKELHCISILNHFAHGSFT